MKVLVVGSGGREHALAWALSRDPEVKEIYAAPGNPGIAEIATCVPINATSVEQLVTFAKERPIDLTVVGPEAALALGIVDAFRKRKLKIFGPERRPAQIETSKTFAKDLCTRFRIPTAQWDMFMDESEALEALKFFGPPWVVKTDGLAAGKGTTITMDRDEAEAVIHRDIQRPPGRIVLERFIDGWEATFMATVSAGQVQWVTPVFQDYKPAFDGDAGPNTGGMGCFTPVPTVTPALIEKVKQTILQRAVTALSRFKIHFQGLLNLNAIVAYGTEDPYVLEFNSRFGDPEAQGVMALVEKGLAAHLYAVADNSKKPTIPICRQSACVVVVLASKGYPTTQSLGDKITIQPVSNKNVVIFHAGTSRNPAGELVTAGGRVLNVVATGDSVDAARRDVYSTIRDAIQFDGMHYRLDIGAHGMRQRDLETPNA